MKRKIPIARRRAVLAALYEALRQFQRGELVKGNIGVGMLPIDLSGIYLAVEKALETA